MVFLILAVGLTGFWLSQNMTRIPAVLQTVFEWVGERGSMAPVYFVVVFTLGTFLLMSIFLMSLAGGFLFGVIPGALIVIFAMLFSSALAYLMGHYCSRKWVNHQIQKNRLLQAMDQVIKNAGWRIVILSRLAPIFPFTPLNFVFGASKIKFWNFLLASFAGFLPGSFLNAYLGTVAGSLLGVQERTPLPGEKLFLSLSIATAIFATFYMTKLTRKVLAGGTS